MCLQTERMRGGDIDHSDMMKVIAMAVAMMNIWIRMTAEVLMLTTVLESVIIAHISPGWSRVFSLSSDIVNT